MSHSTLCSLFVAEVELCVPAAVLLAALPHWYYWLVPPSRTVSQNKPFLLLVALVMVFNHSNRKITNRHTQTCKQQNIYKHKHRDMHSHAHNHIQTQTNFKLPRFGGKRNDEEVSYYTIKSLAHNEHTENSHNLTLTTLHFILSFITSYVYNNRMTFYSSMWWAFVRLKLLLSIIELVCRKAKNELAPLNFDAERHILNCYLTVILFLSREIWLFPNPTREN